MKYLQKILTVSLLLLFSCKVPQEQKVLAPPNILIILADDCTHWDIGTYGSLDAITPNIDRLAMEGIKFNRCYQAAPMCSPTRHNILTGLYPLRSGAYPNHTKAYEGTKSIVHYLKPLGYRVAQSGKRHIGPKSVFPFEYLGKGKNPDFELVDGFLKDVKATREPFVLYLASNEPHSPWNKGDTSLFDPDKVTLPPHFIDTPETRKAYCDYLAEINYLDGQVGEALALVEKYGFNENTLVVFASEQGNSFPFAKWTLYEAGVKSALIARFPGVIEPNTQTDAIVEYTDLLPTFIDLADGGIAKNLDGKSLVPIFKNHNDKIKEYSFSLQTSKGISSGGPHYGIRSVVGEEYRYIWNLTPEAKFHNIITDGPKKAWYESWKEKAKTDDEAKILIERYQIRPKEELYAVKNDKWCLINLAEEPRYEEIKENLRKELLQWMEYCDDKGQETELNAVNRMKAKS